MKKNIYLLITVETKTYVDFLIQSLNIYLGQALAYLKLILLTSGPGSKLVLSTELNIPEERGSASTVHMIVLKKERSIFLDSSNMIKDILLHCCFH